MMPQEDVTWPRCVQHNSTHWCHWTSLHLKEASDAEDIPVGVDLSVPIVPSLDIFASARIGEEIVSGMVYELFLVRELLNPFDPNDDDLEQVGMFTKGEGRASISSTFHEWARANCAEKCEYNKHGFAEEMNVQKVASGSAEKWAMTWCLAFHKKCYYCLLSETSRTSSQAPVTFDAASFGLGQVSTYNNSTASNARSNRARDALRQQYGR